jgi:hypothetical protein
VRARRRGSPEIAGSRCAAGDAGEEERKGERGRRQVGSGCQRKRGERARAIGEAGEGARLSAGGGGGGPGGVGRGGKKSGPLPAGPRLGEGRENGPRGKKLPRGGREE